MVREPLHDQALRPAVWRPALPLPAADRGRGGTDVPVRPHRSQVIDVSAWAREVDTDSILVALGAYMTPEVQWAGGAWFAPGQVEVRFYDRGYSPCTSSLPDVARDLGREIVVNTAEEPGIDNIDPATGLRTGNTPVPFIRRYATAVVPKGTRAIRVFLVSLADPARARSGPSYFDVLSLELSHTRPLLKPVLRTLPVRVRRGRVLRVIGANWVPGETVTLMSASGKPFRTLLASAAGGFGMRFDVKRTARRGRVTMVACQRDCTLRAVARFRVIS